MKLKNLFKLKSIFRKKITFEELDKKLDEILASPIDFKEDENTSNTLKGSPTFEREFIEDGITYKKVYDKKGNTLKIEKLK